MGGLEKKAKQIGIKNNNRNQSCFQRYEKLKNKSFSGNVNREWKYEMFPKIERTPMLCLDAEWSREERNMIERNRRE